MRRGPSSSSLLVLSLLIVGAAGAQGKSAKLDTVLPQIAFEDAAVVASGLTPGKSMVWFGVEHAIDAGYSGDIYQHCTTGTVAADGTARLDLGRAVIPRSYWVAVDLDSGGYAVAAPGAYPLAQPLAPSVLVQGGGVSPDEILDHRPYLMGLTVRPGVGAWSFVASDGGPLDLDGASDGKVTLSLAQFAALAGSPAAPAQVDGTDLWFIVAPLTMEISVHKDGVALQ